MVKGVNKMIVEVANPDNEYFERAIFFIRPQMRDTSPHELRKNADEFMNSQAFGAQSGRARQGAAKSKAKSMWFVWTVAAIGILGIAAVIVGLVVVVATG